MDVTVSGVADNVYSMCKVGMSFVSVVKAAMADGWDPSKDLPDVMIAAVKDMAMVVDKFPDAMAEVAADKAGAMKAIGVAAMEMAAGMIK